LDIFANADSPLLPVKHFKRILRVFHPIHNVKREILADGINYRVTLFVFVDKFPLILRAYVEFSSVALNAFLVRVDITLY
jgi:hypothetical protein